MLPLHQVNVGETGLKCIEVFAWTRRVEIVVDEYAEGTKAPLKVEWYGKWLIACEL